MSATKHARVLLLCLLCAWSPGHGDPAAIAPALRAAQQALADGDPGQAEKLLKDHLQQAPADASARLLLVETYLGALRPKAAEEQLERLAAQGADPDLVLAPLVRALLMRQDFDQAFARLREAGTDGQPERLALAGEALFGRGDTEAARAQFDAALALDSGQVRALLGRARLAAAASEFNTARDQVEAALAVDPESWEAWDLRGRIAAQAGQFETAEQAFSRAIATAPTDWPLQYARALVRIGLHDYTAAESDLKHIAAAVPQQPLVALLRGRLQLARGELAAAQATLQALVQQFPDNLESVLLLAEALQRDQRWGPAKGYLLTLAQASDAPPLARLMLARSHLGLREYDQAEALLLGLGDDPTAQALLAQVLDARGLQGQAEAVREALDQSRTVTRASNLLDAGQGAAARDLLAPLLGTATPPPRRTAILLARAYAMNGQIAPAVALTERLQAAYPDDANVLFTAASVLTVQGDQARAKALYEQAAALDQRAAAPLVGLSLLALRADDPAAAQAYARQAMTLEPDNAAVTKLLPMIDGEAQLRQALSAAPADLARRVELARLLVETGRGQEALVVLDQAPAAQATDADLLLWRALAELRSGAPAAAIATVGRMSAAQAEQAPVRWLLGRAHAAAGQVEPMVEDLLAVMHGDVEGGPDPILMARLLNTLPEPAQRDQALERLAAAAPESVLVILLRANAAMLAKDYGAAAAGFGALARQAPDNLGYILARAGALSAVDDAPRARAELESWLADHPGNIPVQRFLAESYLLAGEQDRAIGYFRAIVAADKNDALSRNNLAMLLLERKPDEALAFAQAARALQPQQPDIADTLGQVLMRRGQTNDALALFEEARRASEDPLIGLHLAQALLATKADKRAVALLQTLAAQPSAVQDEARALLDAHAD